MYGSSQGGDSLCLPFLVCTHRKTKSPTWKAWGWNLRVWYHQSVCWYLAILVMVMSLDSSSKSIGLNPGDLYCSSVGNTSATPYTMKNRLKLFDLLVIVRKLQSTEGTSAAHFPTLVLSQVCTSSPSKVRMRGFRPCIIRPLACSTCLFICG
jgi:hypothetical protein